jgi:NAD(P)-dependent dehydrogenase (short-subunit alcohol dehydrogenase family)
MPIKEFDLTGKVALVTGAGRGICRGVAEVLAEAGADLAVNALTPRYLEPTAQAIAKATGRKVVPITGDMTKSSEVDRVVAKAMEAFGRIDILVNGPGDSIRAPLAPRPGMQDPPALSDEDLMHVLNLNLTQAMLMTRAVAPQMLERRSGKIISISGFSAVRGGVTRVVYSSAKMGLMGFTRAQALEWAPFNIHVNCIAPGLFRDPDQPPSEEQLQGAASADRIPLGRHGSRRDAGLLALYLASSASDYMTGQTLFLEGGVTL